MTLSSDDLQNQHLDEKDSHLGVDFYSFLRIIRDERKVVANVNSI